MKSKKQKKKLPPFIKFMLIIVNLLTIVFLTLTFFSGLVPLKYFIIIAIVLLIFDYISSLLIIKRNKKKRLTGLIISLLLVIIYGIGIFYECKTNNFLESITSTKKAMINYSIIVKNDSSFSNINEVKDLGVLQNHDDNYGKAIEKINKDVGIVKKEVKDNFTLFDTLIENRIDAFLIEESQHKILEENYDEYRENIKVLYTFGIEYDEQDIKKDTDITKNPFILYISGIDTYGSINVNSRSDVNMIVVVNPNTHKIALVDIPRDYYVSIYQKEGNKDKLTHAGNYGVETSVKTVEKLLDIDINYYVKFNFTSVVKIVDKIGGIRVYSDETFTSGLYDPGTTQVYQYYKGWNTLNGKETLSFARERYSFNDGDRVRGKHQQAVIESILDKVTSPAIIVNYTSFLDALSETFTTNLDDDNLRRMINKQINENIKWEFEKIVLNGEGSLEYTYSYPMFGSYVMVPFEDSINEGKALIKKIYNGEN